MTFYRRISGLFSILTPLIVCLLVASTSAHAGKITQYKFGVFPFMPMSALIKYYNSVSMDFTRRVNKRVIAQTRPTFKEFSDEIEKETYDIIFIQPFDYPKAYAHNYRPLARRSEPLDAILVTRTDAPIKSIKDLAGKTLVNPPQEAAISQVIRKELIESGMDWQNTIKMIYTRNHFACIQMVLARQADACSTTTPVLHHWQNTRLKKKKLHIIHQAESVPHTLYMAHKRVPKQDREKLKQAILSWDSRPEGKMILKIFNLTSFVEAKDSEYDVIRNYWNRQ